MDAFSLIQNFFTRMNCNFCSHAFDTEDIQLLRQDEGIFIVNVFCNHCNTQNGVAMVGMEVPGQELTFQDPELTPDELERLGKFEAIKENDVLAAHDFFSGLDAGWMKHIPEHLRTEPVEADESEVDEPKDIDESAS